jgi:hypothetical protein
MLLAKDAPVGVVIRRGPSKSVCTLLWDRQRDEFRAGQWLKGRIYERRSDLSPDGKYLLYFAMNGRWDSEAKGSWTAISRAPYLKAMALFPKGDCWHGGGMFTSRETYWLNDGCGHSVLRNMSEVNRDQKFQPSEQFGGECPGVYYPRLLRDGWTIVEREDKVRTEGYYVFEKPLAHGWILRKIAHAEVGAPKGKSCYWDEHELLNSGSGKRVKFPDWEWADIDGQRLVWAEHGKLFAGPLSKQGVSDEVQFFDFNDMAFERLKAPY